MDNEYWEQKQIRIYWWNNRNKTLDFKGTYKDYLIKKEIEIKEINLKDKHYFNISFSCGSANFKIQIYGRNYQNALDIAIIQFLTYLGDKTLFESYNRKYKLNWW